MRVMLPQAKTHRLVNELEKDDKRFISFHFILNFLFTVAPSTKGSCFSGGRGKNLITMFLEKKNAKLE